MIPQRWIEAYLKFLLRYRGSVTIAIVLFTAMFGYSLSKMRMHTDFFDFYPKYRTFADAYADCREQGKGAIGCIMPSILHPGPDPYIKIYTDFRRMFGSANILSVIVEVKNGDIYNPETLQKIDRVTKAVTLLKGVVPYQILSIAHPKVKSITAREGSLQIREIFYPEVPKTQEDADRVKFAVYSTKGVRGLYTSLDDTAAVVHAGFWEEALDFRELHKSLMALKAQEDDANHTIYITGFPWLYTSVLEYSTQLLYIFGLTLLTLSFLLWTYFRTWTGIWVPIFSAVLSSVWGLGIASVLGFNLDPLVLVIPIFLTARALSHSVQSMDRYHEEYYRLKDKQEAIVVSYSHLFQPAMSGIVTDGIGLLIVAVAPIPLIQKVSIFASFWIISIFISVVSLHPILLSYIDPPAEPLQHDQQRKPLVSLWPARFIVYATVAAAVAVHKLGYVHNSMLTFLLITPVLAWYWVNYGERAYTAWTRWTILATIGVRRWYVVGLTVFLFIFLPIWGWTLKVGDMSPGSALLFPDHPYNVAWKKLNEKFLGASQLIVIADTKQPDGIKNAKALGEIEEFSDYMQGAEGASGAVTIIDVVKRLAQLYHDGDPKWGLIPDNPKEIGQLFYVFTSSASAGDLDRFMDPSGRYGTVLTLFRGYSHDIIKNSINFGKRFTDTQSGDLVEFKFAGGLFGILAAVNDAVENSYWTNLGLIFFMVFFCLYLTYGSLVGAALLMIPVVLSQLAAEAFMVWMNIDMNVNSLPVAAAGAGVGVDYGIYHFSRMIDCYDEVGDLDEAVDYATATTGKAIIFTGTTMIAGTGFFYLSDLKFLAEMGLLLTLLMTFNKFGALIVVPALVKVIRPAFLTGRVLHSVDHQESALAAAKVVSKVVNS
ncbi:MAG: MMPL family transporter [Deltaproteobacteria bacterium]|nr:MMPL family transporter [Deltaproteobacteria bacterium]